MSRSGGPSIAVTEDAAFPVRGRATWSPDGRSVVFPSVDGGSYGLARVPVQGGRPVWVGTGARALAAPVFSLDGNWIFGTQVPPDDRRGEIWTLPVRRDGSLGDPRRVLGGVLDYEHPSVSRDQKRIAFRGARARLRRSAARKRHLAGRGALSSGLANGPVPGGMLGRFELLERAGAGGMGEVFRALDTAGGGIVALKLLPAAFAAIPARLARFRR